jgi:hypothetical protein
MVAWSEPGFRIVRPVDRFGMLVDAPIGPVGQGLGAVALVGAVYPDVDSITVDLGNRSQYTFNVVSEDGWFAVILPGAVADISRTDGGLVNAVISLELIDDEGRVLATATRDSTWP